MQFDFPVAGLQGSEISVWDAARLVNISSVEFHKLRNVLEEFGQRSATAQGLRAPITDIWRLRSSDQRLYLQTAATGSNACMLLGGLKVGKKKLYIHRSNGAIAEVEPLCVLDFYVHEGYQRQGVGKAVFEHMLEVEQLSPEQLAYDRPSPKLLSFLRKHYGLCSYVPQSNNFVVFEQYFNNWSPASTRACRGPAFSSSGGGSNMQNGLWATLGNGRQSVHVVGTAAAAGMQEAVGQQWAPTSLRPPTPSLQHSVQLHTAQVGSSGSSCGGRAAAAALTASLGGPGCTPAGMPTHKPDRWHTSPLAASSQQQPEVQYARGAGFKMLVQGPGPALDDSNTFKGYEQALLVAAANPAPVISSGVRDSLDQFTSSMVNGSAGGQGSSHCTTPQRQQQQQLGAASSSRDPPWATSDLRHSSNGRSSTRSNVKACGSGGAGYTTNPQYLLNMPYGSLEPPPGSMLPPEVDRVSLRRQEQQQQQQLQQRLQQQQVARWEAVGVGPAGHLLAAPTSSYAVPTAAMAEVIGRGHQQQQDQGGCNSPQQQQQQQQQQGVWQQQQQPSSSLGTILSWDGLPTAAMACGKKQQQQQLYPLGSNCSFKSSSSVGGSKMQQQRGMQPVELGYPYSNSSSRSGSGGGIGQETLDTLGTARAAARSHRAGSGAASCLRMV